MKKILLTTIISFSLLFVTKFSINAQVYIEYPEYNVDVKINQNTSLDITETAVYNLTSDDAHGLRRDITLNDPLRDSRCRNVQDLYCGGFDRIELIQVRDLEGNDITNQISVYKVTDEDTNEESFRIEWELWHNGQSVTDYEVGWVIQYRIHGSIINLNDGDYFYWNLLPGERGGRVDKSTVRIELPSGQIFDTEKFTMYGDFNYEYKFKQNTIEIAMKDLPSSGDVTAVYKFNKGLLDLPGNLQFQFTPPVGIKVEMDGFDQTENLSSGILKSVPSGTHKVTVSHVGYQTRVIDVNVLSNETQIISADLEPQGWMSLLLISNILVFLCGLCLIPFLLVAYFMHYRNRGRDKQMPKTIIPLFHPPKEIRPYLLGALKDESVDREDIVGSIIDLAYRGFIKIEEIIKNKDYKLTRLMGKEGEKTDDIEASLLDALFNGEESVNTSELKGSFFTKYVRIQDSIYKEMVARDYFNRSPKTTIASYVGLGVVSIMIGIFSGCVLSTLFIGLTGYVSIFTPSIALVILGFAILISAKFMPAKTPTGSRVFAEILGFKMYLHTAERYRVQNLKPEEFVKYLSYAIVFGIEKEWAEKFKDIYKGVPDWYVGSNTGLYDALWISSFARSFSNSAVQNITPISSTSSGSGWSGGGSFGGFSGGGGGGGSSGAW